MKLNMLAFAVPLFIVFMSLEFFIARKKKLPYFNLHNSIANISVGIAERLLDVLVTGMFFFVYDYLQRRFGIFKIRSGVFLWIALLLCTDFLWYWYHRLAHEINLFWAVHVVHHQSEDFNYTVSARITVFQAFVRTGFWCVLPIIGFPAQMITGMLLVHGLYPFFIHTRMIGRLGILEYVLVTPSHHRVHHASNEQYLDKNYGDVFIIWDKLFGTFQKEEDGREIRYGLTHPLKSYSFLWQHFHFLAELFIAAGHTRGFINKVKLLFGRPDTVPAAARRKAEQVFHIYKINGPVQRPLNRYVVWQMAVTIVALFCFILLEHSFSTLGKTAFSIILFLTLINCGAIMEQKKWIFYLEFGRLFLLSMIIIAFYPNLWLISALIVAGFLA
ncbi:MAG: sterol desaturase family protein, partial [Bacteroidetes bacterium]|nr:sterol desaturase family protein [Bacteroidota bacterium]